MAEHRKTRDELELEEAEKLYSASRSHGFQDLASEEIYIILDALENKLAMLAPVDADFVLACKFTLAEGAKLTPEAQDNVRRIARLFGKTGHNVMSDEAPLSMGQVIRDLASSIHMLSPQEKQFAMQMATKIKAGQPLAENEMAALLRVHANKGF